MKYQRHTITIEVLANDLSDFNHPVTLADIHYHITEGHCSGQITVTKVEELTRDEMAEALEKQGSDPTFLTEDEDEELVRSRGYDHD